MKYFYVLSLLLMSTALYAGTPIMQEEDGDDTNEYLLYDMESWYGTMDFFIPYGEEDVEDILATFLFDTKLPKKTELDNAIKFCPQADVKRLLDEGADPFKLNYNHRLSSCEAQKANFVLVEKAQRNYCKTLLLYLQEKCPNMPKEIRESLLVEYVQEDNEQIHALLHSKDYPLARYQNKNTSDITIPYCSLYPLPIDDID